MRLKTALIKCTQQQEAVTCVGWNNSEELYSCSDDHKLLKWSVMNKESSRITDLPVDIFPLDMHWPSRAGVSGTSSKHIDMMLISGADGKFHLLNRTGRIERSVDAHKGAVLIGKWSFDGTGFMTAGEDGQVKVWSRSGMLRSTLATCETPVYSAAWAPDSQAILHVFGRMLSIRSLAPNTKPNRWKAHEGLVLNVAWCPTNGLIVSGGEDCRYRVWDPTGLALYVSSLHDYPITALAWSPAGDLFTVGSYNTLRLCDFSGWSHSLDKLQTGSIYNMAWSSDGTQVAAACANGHILFAHIIGRQLDWKQYSATVTGRKKIIVHDVISETEEQLDIPDRIIQVALAYEHLVVATPNQCHVYNTSNWNTPIIFDLKEGAVCMLILAERHFAIVERSSIGIYNYQGRLLTSPRWSGINPEGLNRNCMSLGPDIFVSRDQNDQKLIHLFELTTNRTSSDSGSQIQHNLNIVALSVNQCGPPNERQLAVIDANRDIYLVAVRNFGPKPFNKLGSQVHSVCWHSDANMIAVIQDSHLIVWYCPAAACHDPTLLRLTSLENDEADLGRSPLVHAFQNTVVSIRKADGSLINVLISPFILNLHRYVMENKWDQALKLCRSIQDRTAWACLAALATQAKVLDSAEEAYSAINQSDKVIYIQHLKEFSSRAQQMAGAALMSGNTKEAESLLLQSGLVYHAIASNVHMHLWNRALDLALKHKSHIDTVLFLRKQYLQSLDKTETNPKFLQLVNTVQIDEEKVKQKINAEMEKT